MMHLTLTGSVHPLNVLVNENTGPVSIAKIQSTNHMVAVDSNMERIYVILMEDPAIDGRIETDGYINSDIVLCSCVALDGTDPEDARVLYVTADDSGFYIYALVHSESTGDAYIKVFQLNSLRTELKPHSMRINVPQDHTPIEIELSSCQDKVEVDIGDHIGYVAPLEGFMAGVGMAWARGKLYVHTRREIQVIAKLKDFEYILGRYADGEHLYFTNTDNPSGILNLSDIVPNCYPNEAWSSECKGPTMRPPKSNAVFSLAFIPAGQTNLSFYTAGHNHSAIIEVLTLGGKHLLGGSTALDVAGVWQTFQPSAVTPANGFNTDAVYDKSQLNGTGGPLPYNYPTGNPAFTIDGMTFRYSGDPDGLNLGENSPRCFYLDIATTDLIIMAMGCLGCGFEVRGSWRQGPAPLSRFFYYLLHQFGVEEERVARMYTSVMSVLDPYTGEVYGNYRLSETGVDTEGSEYSFYQGLTYMDDHVFIGRHLDSDAISGSSLKWHLSRGKYVNTLEDSSMYGSPVTLEILEDTIMDVPSVSGEGTTAVFPSLYGIIGSLHQKYCSSAHGQFIPALFEKINPDDPENQNIFLNLDAASLKLGLPTIFRSTDANAILERLKCIMELKLSAQARTAQITSITETRGHPEIIKIPLNEFAGGNKLAPEFKKITNQITDYKVFPFDITVPYALTADRGNRKMYAAMGTSIWVFDMTGYTLISEYGEGQYLGDIIDFNKVEEGTAYDTQVYYRNDEAWTMYDVTLWFQAYKDGDERWDDVFLLKNKTDEGFKELSLGDIAPGQSVSFIVRVYPLHVSDNESGQEHRVPLRTRWSWVPKV